MEEVYGKLFEDTGHVLVLFVESAEGDHATWVYCGKDASTVIDSKARDIIYSAIEDEYYSDKSEEEMFSDAFSNAVNEIIK